MNDKRKNDGYTDECGDDLFVSQMLDFDFENESEMVPLHTAAKMGNLADVCELLAADNDPNEIDQYGKTPLHRAVEFSIDSSTTRKIVEKLIEAGTDVNAQDLQGRTALHEAASDGFASS